MLAASTAVSPGLLETSSSSEASSIDEVIQKLEDIVAYSILHSEREGYFAALYLRVTNVVKQKIGEGYFDDNPRMERLDVVFANRYITAYEQYKKKQPCSASWQLAFDTCRNWQPLVLQHLFLGMNAHIGLDLGIAAATVCPGNSIQSLHDDFNKINSILASLVATVRDELTQMWPLLKIVNWLAGKLEEEIANFSMETARDAAWKEALAYAAISNPGQQQAFIALRDGKVAAFGSKIASPGLILTALISVLRMFEKGSVKRKVEILNQSN